MITDVYSEIRLEDQHADRKSLRVVTGRTADLDDLARTCVCFADGEGGRLQTGIEDGEKDPLPAQVVPVDVLDRVRKRVAESTVNVQALPTVYRASNGGEFVELMVKRSPNVASTSDGRYFLRVADTCVPVLGDDVMRLIAEADGRFQLTQRERITLGALGQSEGMTARELATLLEAERPDALTPWLGRLVESGLIQASGKTSGTRYFVAPDWLRGARLDRRTTLTRITPHRLRALILEDLARYPDSSSADINRRIGAEISGRTVKRALDALVTDDRVTHSGERRWRRYRLAEREHKGQIGGEFS